MYFILEKIGILMRKVPIGKFDYQTMKLNRAQFRSKLTTAKADLGNKKGDLSDFFAYECHIDPKKQV